MGLPDSRSFNVLTLGGLGNYRYERNGTYWWQLFISDLNEPFYYLEKSGYK
jgi:hypothetical protein